jgi:hypothetical protein
MPTVLSEIERSVGTLTRGRAFAFVRVSGCTEAEPSVPGESVAPVLQFRAELPQNPIDYGLDILVFTDLDDSMTPVGDSRVLSEAIARRFLTPRGHLAFHPDYGLDLRGYLNDSIDDDFLLTLKADMEMEANQDERVESAKATVSYDEATKTLTAKVELESAVGPFSFTLEVSELTSRLTVDEG